MNASWLTLGLWLVSSSPASTPMAPTSSASKHQCRAAVLDLVPGEGVTLERARALSEVVTGAVGATLDCAVMSRSEIEALMNFEVSKQLSGCDSESCLTELGDALGVSRLVLGSIQQVDGETLVALRLVDTATMHVERRVTDSTGHQDAVIPFVEWMSRRLIVGDEAAGARPVNDDRGVDRGMSGWRALAWTTAATAGVAGVLAGASGLGSVLVAQSLPALKSARGANRSQIASLEDSGPWLAGGANLGLYVAGALALTSVPLFVFFPTDDVTEQP